MTRRTYLPILAVTILALAVLACGESTTGTLVATTKPGEPTPTVGTTIYKIGDVVQVKDHTITLNSADVKGGNLVANFTIENKSDKDLNISSMIGFNAKNADGEKLDYAMCDSSPIDGKILPADKTKGNVCWKAATKAGVKIYYEATMFSSGAIVWELK
jgi:hypothetical protein